jgi:predicted MFS family arabinose efflux permease
MIFGCVFFIVSVVVLRETNRSIVGDGSVPPQKWNRSLAQIIWKDELTPNPESLAPARNVVNPFRSLLFLRNKENLIICIYNGVLFAGYASVIGIFASQLHERYNYNEVQIGLCFLPTGAGTLLSKWTISKLIDWNYQREADKQG